MLTWGGWGEDGEAAMTGWGEAGGWVLGGRSAMAGWRSGAGLGSAIGPQTRCLEWNVGSAEPFPCDVSVTYLRVYLTIAISGCIYVCVLLFQITALDRPTAQSTYTE